MIMINPIHLAITIIIFTISITTIAILILIIAITTTSTIISPFKSGGSKCPRVREQGRRHWVLQGLRLKGGQGVSRGDLYCDLVAAVIIVLVAKAP